MLWRGRLKASVQLITNEVVACSIVYCICSLLIESRLCLLLKASGFQAGLNGHTLPFSLFCAQSTVFCAVRKHVLHDVAPDVKVTYCLYLFPRSLLKATLLPKGNENPSRVRTREMDQTGVDRLLPLPSPRRDNPRLGVELKLLSQISTQTH